MSHNNPLSPDTPDRQPDHPSDPRPDRRPNQQPGQQPNNQRRSKYQNAAKFFITAKKTETLRNLIAAHIPNATPDIICESGGVWLNQKRITHPLTRIEAGQTIIVYTAPDQGRKATLSPSQILLDTPHFCIIEKPPALTVCSDRSNRHYNLTTAVETWFKSQKIDYVPQPLNRLDFMVSGPVIYPKSKRDEQYLFRLSQSGKLLKVYYALLPHSPKHPNRIRCQDTIEFKGKTRFSKTGKKADTLLIKQSELTKQSKRSQNTTLTNMISTTPPLTNTIDSTKSPAPAAPIHPPLADHYAAILRTGRRHQIRYHTSRYLSPIFGDTLYGSRHPHPEEEIALYCAGFNFWYKGHHIRYRWPRLTTAIQDFLAVI